jgi:hypothetical protein
MQKQQEQITAQQQTIDSLQSMMNTFALRFAAIENCLSNLPPGLGCNISNSAIMQNNPDAPNTEAKNLAVTLSNKNAVVLHQNSPNPFAEQTVINYAISDNVKSAQLVFTDNMGKVLKTMEISERGNGTITVYGGDLSTGIYSYTLIVDGVSVATKRMVKSN